VYISPSAHQGSSLTTQFPANEPHPTTSKNYIVKLFMFRQHPFSTYAVRGGFYTAEGFPQPKIWVIPIITMGSNSLLFSRTIGLSTKIAATQCVCVCGGGGQKWLKYCL